MQEALDMGGRSPGYLSRIDRAFTGAPLLPLTDYSKYVLFSDCHRGVGTSNDNFLKNRHLYLAALKHYYEKGFAYIELGDGDELWENRSMPQIVEIHSDIFRLLSRFYQSRRLYMLYGNHDLVKKCPKYCHKTCSSFYCIDAQCTKPLLPDMPFYSGLILEDSRTHGKIYMTHGHQADIMNSTFWKLNRFLVRYIWKPLEHFGVLDPTSAAKNYTVKEKTENRLSRWADINNRILITGHTHRPALSEDSRYFNTGSCIHPSCITCIEIERRCLTLVKWTLLTRSNQDVYVARETLAGSLCLADL